MSTPGPVPPSAPEAPPVQRELMLFLVQLSSALNRSRAYPPGHPVLTSALDQLGRQLDALLDVRRELTIGAARNRLTVEGGVTDRSHGILRDLADRVHRHQLAAIQFRPGVTQGELADLLAALGAETWRQGAPLGLEPTDDLAGRWPHVSLEPIPLDQLELGAGGGAGPAADRADLFWQGLVNTALLQARDASGEEVPPETLSGAHVATAIRRRRGEAAYDQAVVAWLLQLDEQMGSSEGVATVRERVTELFAHLDRDTLGGLMRLGATVEERREIVFRGARALPIQAVLDLLQSAADVSGEDLSPSLLRILSKLAGHAGATGQATVPGAEDLVRDSVRHLVTSWGEGDGQESRTPRQLLELLTRPGDSPSPTTGKAAPAAVRVAQLGLELGVSAPAVSMALRAMKEAGDLEGLIDLHDRGGAEGLDVGPVRDQLADPAFAARLLASSATDPHLLDQLVDRLGEGAAEPLLDALETAESSSRRKWAIRRLVTLGPGLGPMLVTRLPGKPWFVIRNLLGLITALPERPQGFDPLVYLGHDDPRVRREAFKLLVADSTMRGQAILKAVTDPDPGIALLALGAASDNCPAELPSRLVTLLNGGYRERGLRTQAIKLLGRRPTPAGRDWLLRQVVTDRGWWLLRRRVLVAKSPDMLAALAALAAGFRGHPEADAVLQLAQDKGDGEVRAAARGGAG